MTKNTNNKDRKIVARGHLRDPIDIAKLGLAIVQLAEAVADQDAADEHARDIEAPNEEAA